MSAVSSRHVFSTDMSETRELLLRFSSHRSAGFCRLTHLSSDPSRPSSSTQVSPWSCAFADPRAASLQLLRGDLGAVIDRAWSGDAWWKMKPSGGA